MYSVTLKTGSGVVQGHRKWRRSIDHIWLSIGRHCKYSSIWYRFWVIWHWMISWPWNLGYRSLKIIQSGTMLKIGCSFLFGLYCNYGRIFNRLWDIQRQSIAWPWKLGLGLFKVIENGAVRPLKIWDPPNISETTRARKLKFKTQLDMTKYSLWVYLFPLRHPGGPAPPNVNLGPP